MQVVISDFLCDANDNLNMFISITVKEWTRKECKFYLRPLSRTKRLCYSPSEHDTKTSSM